MAKKSTSPLAKPGVTVEDDPNGRLELLNQNHKIRIVEQAISVAKWRHKWSNLSLLFGPLLGIALYAMLWVPQIPRWLIWAIYIPTVPVVIGFCGAAYRLKTRPGGPSVKDANNNWVRRSEGELELELARLRENRKHLVASTKVSTKVRRVAYKEDAYAEIDKLRTESKRYRRVNNILQGVLIIGSLAATGASGVATEVKSVRWAILGITFVVGISSGFMGYFKYKERSFYLQQTADAIEQEWEAVEVGVGRYKRAKDEEEALEDFVAEVHRLKSEQKKRQQNLEQPPESRGPNE